MYNCMAAAVLQWKYFFAAFEQKRPACRQAGCNKKPEPKLKIVALLKAPNKNGNEKFIAVQYYFKNYLAMFTALFSLITVTFICPGKVISVCIF